VHSRVSDAARWAIGTRSASLIVVMSGFQLPSREVAAAAEGVAFKSRLSARACSWVRFVALSPGCSLCFSSASARFTSTHEWRTSATALLEPHEASKTLANVSVARTLRGRTSRATSQRIGAGSRSRCARAQRCRTGGLRLWLLGSRRWPDGPQSRYGAPSSRSATRRRRSR
jgi:hypothetical protein